MALKINPLGTHVCGARLLREFEQLGYTSCKLRSQHVVRVVAKTLATQCNVGGITADILAASAKLFQPDVTNSSRGQGMFQRLAIEVREPPRHGKRPDIHKRLNRVRLQSFD